jgi:DNA-binding PadR family transcriptional regulator
MSLKYGVLGFLSDKPRTGYELHKLYPRPARPTIGYIYRALINMAKQGLVESTRVEQEKRPGRNVFSITEAGLAELDRWLGTPIPFMVPRNTQLVQIWFGSRIGKEKLIANLEARRDQEKAVLDALSDTKNWRLPGKTRAAKRDVNTVYRKVAYESAVSYLTREINWLNDIIEAIRRIEEKDSQSK